MAELDSTPDLHGVRALVTGATSGLGRAMAEALAERGAQVVVTGRDASRARDVAQGLGASVLAMAMDVRDPEMVTTAVEAIYERLGGLDLLVANAGVGMRTVNPRFLSAPQPFWEVSPEGFAHVVDTKVNGTFLVTREVVARMLRANAGRVVVISMNTETMTRAGFVPYGPSGAATEALAYVMAADLKDTAVRLNILLPGGASATGMIPEDVSPEIRARLLPPEIMGPPIVWLASHEADDVHGERIIATEFEQWRRGREQ
ncbi:MAG: SDR family oxidoreductase [Acidimicrobiaceae bacterium]|nr:SDR family oxidoreductase [Acidimicrobiaceae bacterium]